MHGRVSEEVSPMEIRAARMPLDTPFQRLVRARSK